MCSLREVGPHILRLRDYDKAVVPSLRMTLPMAKMTLSASVSSLHSKLGIIAILQDGDQQAFSVKSATYYKVHDSFEITYAGMRQITLTVVPE
jgi:hypothetical protein